MAAAACSLGHRCEPSSSPGSRRVRLALGVGCHGCADSREEVRAVQAYRLEFGPGTTEVGEYGGQVGERWSSRRQMPAMRGVTAAYPAMMSRAMSLRMVISAVRLPFIAGPPPCRRRPGRAARRRVARSRARGRCR